jgi:flagellar basal body-associated protein FliL
MPLHSSRILFLQWVLIAVLVVGGGVAFIMLMSKTDQFRSERDANTGNIASLKEQVRQARQTPTPAAEALPEAVSNGPAAATPTPTATPKKR